ncbi:MAG: zf-TFIIB domain-containing protein [Chthoniobacter sp.]|nr:zf-TFIIB domain-containing protein [Chthoniobacter sp.]
MDAQTLHCPDCGAPASSDATQCEHCGARLATIACPSCFGMIFLGSKFCPHCGARVGRVEGEDEAVVKPCPRCQIALQSVALGADGSVKVHECSKCEGLWVDVATFEAICTDREQQAIVLGGASPPPARVELTLDEVRYLHCPQCHTLMNRVNFAGRSGVIVDACRGHGTWFDRDELQHIVEFIRSGGLEMAREREQAQHEALRRKTPVADVASIEPGNDTSGPWYAGREFADVLWFIGGALARLFTK